MSECWRTKADVLKDLGEMNGRRTGAEQLHRHVVQGERPPPIHNEAPDQGEMDYLFGRHGGPCEDSSTEPDLTGISHMLKLVNDMDGSEDDVPKTIYRNRATDEISISKLNPLAGEYVPGCGLTPVQKKHKINMNIPKPLPSMFRRRNGTKTEGNTFADLEPTTTVIKTEQEPNALRNRKNDDLERASDHSTRILENVAITGNDSSLSLNSAIPAGDIDKVRSFSPKEKDIKSQGSPQTKHNLLPNGFPKRKDATSPVRHVSSASPSNASNKIDELKEIQEKLKSTIISSSNDNSLKTKRQKNVAIATLLKLGTIPTATQENTVKLIKPEFFENPPSNADFENEAHSIKQAEKEHLPSSSNSETDLPYIDPDSISKVNGWFNNIECPKPKTQLPEPPVLKPTITFKKKDNASVYSGSSEISNETKAPLKENTEKKAFKPSSYASDLLRKYESNAQRAPAHEDLGSRLERQLRERDELVRQQRLALAAHSAG